MSWPDTRAGITDPDHYTDIDDPAVRELFAAFAHQHLLKQVAPYGETGRQTDQFEQTAEQLDTEWAQHRDPRLRRMWADLKDSVDLWETDPDHARGIAEQLGRAHMRGDLAPDSELWLTGRHARQLTGHAHELPARSDQDAARSRPEPITDRASLRDGSREEVPDHRTAVDKTLGAPRTTSSAISLASVDAAITATDEMLLAEEYLSRAEQRALLLPPQLRETTLLDPDTRTALGPEVQARLLWQIQDLAAEHTRTAETFTGDTVADQATIERLDRLQVALRSARADAIDAGVPHDITYRAYQRGRDNSSLQSQPADRPPGNLDPPQRHTTVETSPDRSGQATASASSIGELTASPGTVIDDAVDAALTGNRGTDWHSPTQHEQQPAEQAELGAEVGS
ncbi:hypothetical protein K7711_19240 [Nocardia sp. CA2R105]|uniref:hypothetical protein n=1 Tax=Nocardia coffeae TaxID=2873381 RepID=UPI001CA65F9C|nr:hypothetical protein [Nocardia coffeae]MBY8858622.1 hypothetical protein [Nocardia coffeae]